MQDGFLSVQFSPKNKVTPFANILLGINQGLAWSMAVVMKIDLVGAKQRGLAVGLNEFAGYLAVGVTALATGYLASVYGLRRRKRSCERFPVGLRDSNAPRGGFHPPM